MRYKDNTLIKLRGLSFKQYMEKYPTFSIVKSNFNTVPIVQEDFDGFCIGKLGSDEFFAFVPADICTMLLLKYPEFSSTAPEAHCYFNGMNMVGINTGIRLDGSRFVVNND